jgi:hypothetical protein
VARLSDDTHSPPSPKTNKTLVMKEADLYEPFTDWLASAFDEELVFAHAAVTASPKGRKRKSGKWSRPDVTAVEVAKLEWLPVTEVTVSTYEIKPAWAAQDVENVYEAAAHGKQAHRANLVIEQPVESAPVSDEVKATARNFGLGLYIMSRQSPKSRFDIDELIEPEIQSPDLSLVERLLQHFFSVDPTLRARYKATIG